MIVISATLIPETIRELSIIADVLALQAAHSVQTGNTRYGQQKARSLPFISTLEFQKFRMASMKWLELIKLPHPLLASTRIPATSLPLEPTSPNRPNRKRKASQAELDGGEDEDVELWLKCLDQTAMQELQDIDLDNVGKALKAQRIGTVSVLCRVPLTELCRITNVVLGVAMQLQDQAIKDYPRFKKALST
jgi:hypothetical protein